MSTSYIYRVELYQYYGGNDSHTYEEELFFDVNCALAFAEKVRDEYLHEDFTCFPEEESAEPCWKEVDVSRYVNIIALWTHSTNREVDLRVTTLEVNNTIPDTDKSGRDAEEVIAN